MGSAGEMGAPRLRGGICKVSRQRGAGRRNQRSATTPQPHLATHSSPHHSSNGCSPCGLQPSSVSKSGKRPPGRQLFPAQSVPLNSKPMYSYFPLDVNKQLKLDIPNTQLYIPLPQPPCVKTRGPLILCRVRVLWPLSLKSSPYKPVSRSECS